MFCYECTALSPCGACFFCLRSVISEQQFNYSAASVGTFVVMFVSLRVLMHVNSGHSIWKFGRSKSPSCFTSNVLTFLYSLDVRAEKSRVCPGSHPLYSDVEAIFDGSSCKPSSFPPVSRARHTKMSLDLALQSQYMPAKPSCCFEYVHSTGNSLQVRPRDLSVQH